MTEKTGLYTADGKEIVTDSIENADPETFDGFIADLKENYPLQWLNMMSTNLDSMVKEYNELALEHEEPIIAAVFVDHEEPEYETYRDIVSAGKYMEEEADAKDKDTDVQEETPAGGGAGRTFGSSEG